MTKKNIIISIISALILTIGVVWGIVYLNKDKTPEIPTTTETSSSATVNSATPSDNESAEPTTESVDKETTGTKENPKETGKDTSEFRDEAYQVEEVEAIEGFSKEDVAEVTQLSMEMNDTVFLSPYFVSGYWSDIDKKDFGKLSLVMSNYYGADIIDLTSRLDFNNEKELDQGLLNKVFFVSSSDAFKGHPACLAHIEKSKVKYDGAMECVVKEDVDNVVVETAKSEKYEGKLISATYDLKAKVALQGKNGKDYYIPITYHNTYIFEKSTDSNSPQQFMVVDNLSTIDIDKLEEVK